MALIGTILYLILVKFISKRSLYLVSIPIAAVINLWLGKISYNLSHVHSVIIHVLLGLSGIHGLYYLPPNTKSFELASTVYTGDNASYIPFILVILLRAITAILLVTPHLYASELFSLKSRCIAAGIVTATTCISLSAATKTFYNFEYWLDMSQTFCIYGVIGFIGWIENSLVAIKFVLLWFPVNSLIRLDYFVIIFWNIL